jgi:predicted  nucleic acid-binding Zn-ribbon protein
VIFFVGAPARTKRQTVEIPSGCLPSSQLVEYELEIFMPFDPYQKLAQIVENVSSRSAEGEEGAAPQIDAPSSIQELMKENETLRRRNAYLEGDLCEISQMLGSLKKDMADLAEAHISLIDDLSNQKNGWFDRDEEQDEYTIEIPATRH